MGVLTPLLCVTPFIARYFGFDPMRSLLIPFVGALGLIAAMWLVPWAPPDQQYVAAIFTTPVLMLDLALGTFLGRKMARKASAGRSKGTLT
jgi:hypothetical protein